MKNVNKILIAITSLLIISCTKDDIQNTNREAVVQVGAPVLLNPTGTFNIILEKAKENNLATSVVWNDAAYSGTATVVNYVIEIAKKGTNFASPQAISTTTKRFKDITVGELNAAANNAGLINYVENEVDIRIKSYVGSIGSGASQFSNSFTIKVTPFRIPAASSLWLVGSATPGGWTWDGDAETEFPLVSPGVYQVSIVLNNDSTFRIFLGNNFTSSGNWDASKNYPAYSNDGYTITPQLINANDNDSNFKYIGPTGTRIFKIDTNTKTITLN